MMPKSSKKELKKPRRVDWSIHSQMRADTTVTIAQGTSMAARMTPRPINLVNRVRAIIIPKSVSRTTQKKVKTSVSPTALIKSAEVAPNT